MKIGARCGQLFWSSMRKTVALIANLLLVGVCNAQDGDTTWRPPEDRNWSRDEITLLTGYNQGRSGFVELGLGRSIYGVIHHPMGVGYHAGVELRPERPSLLGLKLGGYFTFGGAMGIQVIRYQDGSEGNTVMRPEFGIGIWKARMTYAYNINFSPSRLDGINTHMLSLSYAFRLLKVGTKGAKL